MRLDLIPVVEPFLQLPVLAHLIRREPRSCRACLGGQRAVAAEVGGGRVVGGERSCAGLGYSIACSRAKPTGRLTLMAIAQTITGRATCTSTIVTRLRRWAPTDVRDAHRSMLRQRYLFGNCLMIPSESMSARLSDCARIVSNASTSAL